MIKFPHPHFGQSSVAHLGELPVSPDVDLCELQSMTDGNYRVSDHIEQDSEFEPELGRWSDRNVP
jgi:hypothetical protein